MPPPSNPRTNVRRPGAKVSAKPSNNNRRAMDDDDDDDGPGGNGMLSSIVDLMGSMGASVNVASEPQPLSTTTASDVLLTEFTLLEQEFSFLSSSFSGSEATPLGSRQSTGLPIDFDNGDDPTNQFVPPPDVLASLKPMSKDRLLQYAAKLTAIVGNFVCRERHRHLLNDHLGRDLDTPATPPCLSPGELSLTASLRSLRLPPVVQTTTISYAEDFEGNETINEYSVIAEIGRGAYGHVVLAVSNKSEETFAIKVMKKSILKKGSGDSVVKREIAVMRKLRHQNIVPLFEVLDDEAGDKVYLVMKYIDNGPLLHVRDDLTCNPMNPDLAIKYLRQLISGLQYLHQHGVIHRDLKPDNIMLDKAGVVYLTDFGVSDIIEHPQGSVQGTEGTPVFLAPELFSESKNKFKGAPVDVWALGITFYMAIYGRAPFYGKSWREVSTKIKEEAVHFPPGASPEWVDVLGRLLEKDPKKRITLKQLKRHPLFAGLPHQATDNFDDTFDASSANITNGSMAVTDEEVRSSMRRLTKPPSVKTVSMSDMTNKKINAAMDEIRTRISEREVKQIGVLVEEEDGDSSETGSDTPKGKRAHPPDQPPALFNPRSGHKPPSSDGARPPSTGVDDGKFAGKLRQAISMNQSSAAVPLNSMFSTSGGNNTARNNGSVEKTPKLPQINTARAPVVAARRR